MLEFKCDNCNGVFYRHPSQVRGKTKSCSVECRKELYKIILKGENNPNYKKGVYCSPSLCGCGREKDYRAEKCAICSGCGIPKKEEYKKTDQEIIDAVGKFSSYYGVAKEIGVPRRRVASVVNSYGCDISHFCSCRDRPMSIDKVFTLWPKRNNGIIRKYLLQHEMLEYKCLLCGLEDEWNGERLILQLDHIDGNSCNNNLSNLRWLCPNCHTQTSTYCGRNARGKRK